MQYPRDRPSFDDQTPSRLSPFPFPLARTHNFQTPQPLSSTLNPISMPVLPVSAYMFQDQWQNPAPIQYGHAPVPFDMDPAYSHHSDIQGLYDNSHPDMTCRYGNTPPTTQVQSMTTRLAVNLPTETTRSNVSPSKTTEFDGDEYLTFPQTAKSSGFPHHELSIGDRERRKPQGICITSGRMGVRMGTKRKRVPVGPRSVTSGLDMGVPRSPGMSTVEASHNLLMAMHQFQGQPSMVSGNTPNSATPADIRNVIEGLLGVRHQCDQLIVQLSQRRNPEPATPSSMTPPPPSIITSPPTPLKEIQYQTGKPTFIPLALRIPPQQRQGTWQLEELIKLEELVGESKVKSRSGTVDWSWVVKSLGETRSRHQVLIKAAELGLKETSSKAGRRAKQARKRSERSEDSY